jgi:hypothetical protein
MVIISFLVFTLSLVLLTFDLLDFLWFFFYWVWLSSVIACCWAIVW